MDHTSARQELLDEKAHPSTTGAPVAPSSAAPPQFIHRIYDRAVLHRLVWPAIEVTIIALWALVVAHPYLNLDTYMLPIGREFISAIISNHVWVWAQECGACAMWNGGTRGGAPAFVDVYGSMLHPLVIIATLGWGVVNGAKLVVIGALIMAGLAQWWLGHVLGLRRMTRVWTSCLAVAGGHLTGRMNIGVVGVVLSTAACALVLPALIGLVRTGSRRYAVALGVVVGLALLAGQGYMQVGLVFTLLALPLILPWERTQLALLARRGGLALGIALLIASVFLVPFLHFLPSFVKDSDPAFNSSQPFAYIPLDLVISDPDFYTNKILHPQPYPYLYTLYIGWIPVLLVIWGLRSKRSSQEQWTIAFLIASTVLAFWIASATPLAWFSQLLPGSRLTEAIVSIRNPMLMAGLGVAPLIAVAGIGLEQLLALGWGKLGFTFSTSPETTRSFAFDSRWLVAVPLVLALASAYQFTTNWTTTALTDPHVDQILAALRPPDLEWVNPPFGEHYWLESALAMHMKLGIGIRPWNWRDRAFPPTVRIAERNDPAPNMTVERVVDDVKITVAAPGQEYAAITHQDGSRTVCSAQGVGGNIDVDCPQSQAGTLEVKENSWSGWGAQIDGQRAPLANTQWLTLDLPAGAHTIALRYRPWDVPLGVLLSLCGIGLAVYTWRRTDDPVTLVNPQPVADLDPEI